MSGRVALAVARRPAEQVGHRAYALHRQQVNNSAIALAKNPVLHDRSKHIDIRFHFLRDCINDGKVAVDYISTCDQLADMLTKPLGRDRLQELHTRSGVLQISPAQQN